MKSNRVITIAVVLGVAIVAITFLGAARMSGDETPSKEPAKTLTAVKAGSKGVVVFGYVDVENGPGLIPIFPESFPQPSLVSKVHVSEGQTVKENDVLIEFDSTLADAKLAEAKEGVKKAKAVLEGAQAYVAQANLNDKVNAFLVSAQKYTIEAKEAELKAANIDLEDEKYKLQGAKVTMDPKVQAAEKKLLAAQKAVEAEKKKLEALELGGNPLSFSLPTKARALAGVNEAKSAIAIQEAQLKAAEYGKSLTVLKARVGGTIVRSLVVEGMTLGAQTHQPPLTLQPDGRLIVRAEVDQEWASRVSVGQEAVITDDGDHNLKWTGKVVRVSNVFLPKRSNFVEGVMLNDNRALECIVTFDNVDPKNPVRVGQKVKISIGVEKTSG